MIGVAGGCRKKIAALLAISSHSFLNQPLVLQEIPAGHLSALIWTTLHMSSCFDQRPKMNHVEINSLLVANPYAPLGLNCCFQLRPGNLSRGLSTVAIDSILTSGQNGKRIKVLSEEQKEAIRSLQKPQDLPYPERKRQFAALGRRLERPCPPGVLQKWEAAKTDDEKLLSPIFIFLLLSVLTHVLLKLWPHLRFEFLKCFMLDCTLSNVTVEAWHKESET